MRILSRMLEWRVAKTEPTQDGITLTLKIAVSGKEEKQKILAACAYLYDEEVEVIRASTLGLAEDTKAALLKSIYTELSRIQTKAENIAGGPDLPGTDTDTPGEI